MHQQPQDCAQPQPPLPVTQLCPSSACWHLQGWLWPCPRGLWGAGYSLGCQAQGPTARLEGGSPSAFPSMMDTEHGTSICPWWHTGLSWLDSQNPAQELLGEGAEVPVSPLPASLPSRRDPACPLSALLSPGSAAEQCWDSLAALANWDQKSCKRGFVNYTNTSQGASFFLLLCALSAIWQGAVRAWTEGCSWRWENLVSC